jgi:hypothetical protein
MLLEMRAARVRDLPVPATAKNLSKPMIEPRCAVPEGTDNQVKGTDNQVKGTDNQVKNLSKPMIEPRCAVPVSVAIIII